MVRNGSHLARGQKNNTKHKQGTATCFQPKEVSATFTAPNNTTYLYEAGGNLKPLVGLQRPEVKVIAPCLDRRPVTAKAAADFLARLCASGAASKTEPASLNTVSFVESADTCILTDKFISDGRGG
ncbi:MAG: hypothetical protein WDW38_003514 [Sanguina aurantia]